MGATDIYLTFDGNHSSSEIRARIKDQADQDRSYNGHQEGYSGDWQTIHDINFQVNKTFNSFDEAYNFCSSTCEKWSGVAVKYKEASKNVLENKKLLKIKDLIKECHVYIRELETKKHELMSSILDDAKSAKSKTIGCKECGSSVSRSFLEDMKCPVCSTDLTSETNKGKLAKLEEKKISTEKEIAELKAKYDSVRAELIDKDKKSGEKWLVYGLAAC